MSLATFDDALRRVLIHEGGYTNNAADPGGPTNFGITLGDYRKYIKSDATAADVRSMNAEDAGKIYRQRYWQALRCDDLAAGLDYAVFDYGVNSGVARAGKVLRKLLGLLSDTSAIDDAVIAAASAGDPRRLIAAICDERIAFLQSLKTWPVFGVGWSRRVADVRSAATQMAQAAPASNVGLPGKTAARPVSAALVVTGSAAAAPAVGFALQDFMEGKIMQMIWTIALMLTAAGLLYIFVARPVLRASPSWAALYQRVEGAEHSLWTRLMGALVGLRTVIAARLVTLCGIVVGLHDFLLPYVVGVDWTPFTAQIPVWSVPLLIVSTGALFEWLRRLTTGSLPRGV